MTQTETPRASRRLLLLEFVTSERWVFDSRFYPFYEGCAESLGIPVRWLCFGADILTRKIGPAEVVQYMSMTEDELATLRAHVAELQPTHVIISHSVSDEVLALLRGAAGPAGAVKILSVSDHPPPPGVEGLTPMLAPRDEPESPRPGRLPALDLAPQRSTVWRAGRTNWLLSWLGESRETSPLFDQYIVNVIPPSYRAVMANEKARAYKPHVLVVGGVTCDHFSRVAENEHYQGLDLAGVVHDFGCSYCTWFRGAMSDLNVSPIDTAQAQLRRLRDTAGEDGRFCGVVDLLDVRIFRQVDRFAEMVLELGLPPTQFCFEPRLDRFVEVAERLARALPRLASGGHSIYLFRMGGENLVDEENAFYNKHVTLEMIDATFRILKELGERHPEAFEFDPTLGYITCSPWTTLERFELGVARAVERGFEPQGVWLYTPLLLYRGSPITALAARDGIIQDEFEDLSLLYEPSVNQVSFGTLMPWRFKDPRMGMVFALVGRFCAAALRWKYADTVFEGDPLYAQLLAAEKSIGRFERPDLFALGAIALVKESAPPWDRARLLELALERYREAMKEAGPAPSEERPARTADGAAARGPTEREDKLAFLLGAVKKRFADQFRTVEIRGVEEADDALVLRLQVEDTPYELLLSDRRRATPHLFQSEHFSVAYRRETPLRTTLHQKLASRLVLLFDEAVKRYAPDLLPRA